MTMRISRCASFSPLSDLTAKGYTAYLRGVHDAISRNGWDWRGMFHYFLWRHEDFLKSYHKRSNVESTFSIIKRKFGDALRGKTDVAMVNEALCKILCENLVILIHEIHELGI